MKTTGILAVIFSCFLLIGCSQPETLSTARGQELIITKSEKRYIAVSYWAIWCTSCKKEVAAMNKLKRLFSKQLLVLGVDFDGQKGKALLGSMHKLNIDYPVITSDISVKWNLPVPEVLPTTYLLSSKHQIVKTFYGENTADQLQRWLLTH